MEQTTFNVYTRNIPFVDPSSTHEHLFAVLHSLIVSDDGIPIGVTPTGRLAHLEDRSPFLLPEGFNDTEVYAVRYK